MCQKDVVKGDNLKKAFHMFDTRNRGYISKAELKRGLSTFLGEKHAVDDKMLHKIMKEVDRDGKCGIFAASVGLMSLTHWSLFIEGDGKISYEEFVATMLNLAEVPKPERNGLFDGHLIKGFLNIFDISED